MADLTHRIALCLDGAREVDKIIEDIRYPQNMAEDTPAEYRDSILIWARSAQEDRGFTTGGVFTSLRVRVDVEEHEVSKAPACVSLLRMRQEFMVMEIATCEVRVIRTVNKTSEYTVDDIDYGVVTDGIDHYGAPVPDDVLRMLKLYKKKEDRVPDSYASMEATRDHFRTDPVKVTSTVLSQNDVVALVRSAVANMGVFADSHDMRSLKNAMSDGELSTDIKKYVVSSLLSTPSWSIRYTMSDMPETEYLGSLIRVLERLYACGLSKKNMPHINDSSVNLNYIRVSTYTPKHKIQAATSHNVSILGHQLLARMVQSLLAVARDVRSLITHMVVAGSVSKTHAVRRQYMYAVMLNTATEWMSRYKITADLSSGAAGISLASTPDLLGPLLHGSAHAFGAESLYNAATDNILDRDIYEVPSLLAQFMIDAHDNVYRTYARNLTKDLQHVRTYMDSPPVYSRLEFAHSEMFHMDLLLRFAQEALSLDRLVCLPAGQAKFTHEAIALMCKGDD